jgi:predicted Zn-dependent peptidase
VAEHYGPGELILSAAGGVDPRRSCAGRGAFGHLTAGRARRVEPARFAGGEKRVVKDLEQAHFTLALEAPGYRSDDIHTAQIYATALGGGMSSRLFQEIREKRGLCYTIYRARWAPSTIPAC